MVLNMVDDLSRPNQADGRATLAQRLTRQLMASQPAPLAMIVRAASIIAVSAATAGMQGVERQAHKRQNT
jgi:hypothetical protein